MNKQGRMAKVALQLYRDMDPRIQRRAAAMESTCTRGCHHCCYLLVCLTLPEALAIADKLLSDRSVDIGALLQRMAEMRVPLADPNFKRDTYFLQQRACPFLRGGECGIYDVRPSTCRLYYAVTPPEVCGDPSGTALVGSPNMRLIEGPFLFAIMQEYKRAGIPLYTAPLQVMVPLAITYLRDGRTAFEVACQAAQGSDHPNYWSDLGADNPFARESLALAAQIREYDL